MKICEDNGLTQMVVVVPGEARRGRRQGRPVAPHFCLQSRASARVHLHTGVARYHRAALTLTHQIIISLLMSPLQGHRPSFWII
jgi:hypothetical protein